MNSGILLFGRIFFSLAFAIMLWVQVAGAVYRFTPEAQPYLENAFLNLGVAIGFVLFTEFLKPKGESKGSTFSSVLRVLMVSALIGLFIRQIMFLHKDERNLKIEMACAEDGPCIYIYEYQNPEGNIACKVYQKRYPVVPIMYYMQTVDCAFEEIEMGGEKAIIRFQKPIDPDAEEKPNKKDGPDEEDCPLLNITY